MDGAPYWIKKISPYLSLMTTRLFAEPMKRLIKVAGFKAKTFGSAREFINSGHYQSAGVLVLDVRMPGMSGLELQKYLADNGSDMPIIFITAHEDIQASRMALEAGAIEFLKKPFEIKPCLKVYSAPLVDKLKAIDRIRVSGAIPSSNVISDRSSISWGIIRSCIVANSKNLLKTRRY